MNKKDLKDIKFSTKLAWLISIGMWVGILSANIVWFNASERETLFIFSIIVLISTSVCLIPFTYAAYKLDKE